MRGIGSLSRGGKGIGRRSRLLVLARELVPAESRKLNTVGYSDEFDSREEGGSRVEGEGGGDCWLERDMKVFRPCDCESDSTFM